jgi:hypothetical protein
MSNDSPSASSKMVGAFGTSLSARQPEKPDSHTKPSSTTPSGGASSRLVRAMGSAESVSSDDNDEGAVLWD